LILENKNYSTIVGYGIGQYYEKTKVELSQIVKLDYLCDRKWDNSNQTEYDGIPIVSRNDLSKIEKALIIIFSGSPWVYETIKQDFDEMKIEYVHVDEIIGIKTELNGKILKEDYSNGIYEDKRGNKIFFDLSISDKVKVSFQGCGNVLRIGENISVGNLYIRFGNNGFCSIDNNTEIIEARIFVSDAKVLIGKDCLFSTQVILRTHDAHHIFDIETHKRINHSRDIVVGDNVWLAYQVTLLGGATIGTGSVVGTNAVTTSQFGDHKIIVGSPAKVIRNNICWSRENTEFFNRDYLEECTSKEALKYIN